MNEHKYFSYSKEFGFETHETEKQAKSYAEECLDDLRNDPDSRDDDMDSLCWGETKEATKRCDHPLHDYILKKV